MYHFAPAAGIAVLCTVTDKIIKNTVLKIPAQTDGRCFGMRKLLEYKLLPERMRRENKY